MPSRNAKPPTAEEQMTNAERASYEECEEALICLCGDYANHVLTPRILAERRRRRGDNSASPRDYDCRCELSRDDELPICEGRRANCKFSRRAPAPPHRYRDNHVWWTVHAAERRRILASLPFGDEAALFHEIRRMEAALEKENARLIRSLGRGIVRAATAWSA